MRGVFELFGAFSTTLPAPRWLLILGAALDFLLGILFVANPGAAVLGTAVFIGVLAILWGITLVAAALLLRSVGRQLPVD